MWCVSVGFAYVNVACVCVNGDLVTSIYAIGYVSVCMSIGMGVAVWVMVDWLLELYDLATYKVISRWVLTCDSPHSWRLYIAAPLDYQHHDQVFDSVTLCGHRTNQS